jgi:hypothetical protein
MLSAEFEPAIPEIKDIQTYGLNRTVTGIGAYVYVYAGYSMSNVSEVVRIKRSSFSCNKCRYSSPYVQVVFEHIDPALLSW